MTPLRRLRSLLQLEMLESRTLLAGDIAGVESSVDIVTDFDAATPAPELSIATARGGKLTIDVSLLPESVQDLKISGFDTVTIVGKDTFEELDLSHIGTFSGGAVDVTGTLTVTNVASVELHAIAGVAWFFGTETGLNVEDSRSATIVSDLDRLTVSSRNDLNLLSTNAAQKIVVEFTSVKPSLTFPADNVSFKDLAAAPTTGDPDPAEHEPESINVIVISLSKENMTDELAAALKRGDAAAVKTAFVQLKNVQLADSVHSLSFALGSQAELNLADFRLAKSGNAVSAEASGRVVTPDFSQVPDLALAGDNVKANFAGGSNLPLAIGWTADGSAIFGPTLQGSDALALSPPPATTGSDDPNTRRIDGYSTLENVRSSLSGLMPGVSRFSTVSAYIINDVGTQLEPGMLPGLLVDARSSRLRRDGAEWIEI